jgi:predicted tellurium resistance membrane protein TerC
MIHSGFILLTLWQLILLVCAITLGVAAVALFIYSFFEDDTSEYQHVDSEFPSSEHI